MKMKRQKKTKIPTDETAEAVHLGKKHEKKKNRQENRRRTTIFKIAALAVLFVTLVVLVITANMPGSETSTLTMATKADKIETEVFAVRKEQYIENKSGGTVSAAVRNGSHTAKNGVVAYSFTDSVTAQKLDELESLEEKLEYYKSIQSRTSSGGNENSNNSELLKTQCAYADMLSSGNFSARSSTGTALRNSMISKALSGGEKLELTDNIASLEKQIADLKSTVHGYTAITTDVSGYYIYGTDGFETNFDYDKIDSMSAADMLKCMKTPKKNVPPSVFGRIVTGYYWYLIAAVDQSELEGLETGRKYKIEFPSLSSDEIKGELTRVLKDDSEKKSGENRYLCVFKVNEMNESLANLRREKATITKREYTGLKVEKSAIRIIDGQKSIYLVSDGLNYKSARVEILYESDDYDLLKTRDEIFEDFESAQLREKEEKGDAFKPGSIDLYEYPALYDTYVVDGKGVADGKQAK